MAGDRTTQEPTALQSAAEGLVGRAKSGQLLTPRAARWLGIGLVTLLALGVYLYLQSANRKAASRTWADYAQANMDLADYARVNKDTAAGRVARLERARQQFGREGVATFAGSDRAARLKGVESVVAARDEFVKLAADFADDKTLRAACWLDAAEAELALVGVPKETGPTNLGTVANAINHLGEALKVVGDSSAAGEALKARIAKLEADSASLQAAGAALNARFNPPNAPPAFTAPTPGLPPGLPNGAFGGGTLEPGVKLPPGFATPSSARGTPSSAR